MPPHLLTYFEIQKNYENQPKFNVIYSRNNLSTTKDRTYIINFEEYKSLGTHWRALLVNGDNVINFDSFRVEYIPKEIKKSVGSKNIIANIYKIQAYKSIMCGCFYIEFINFMLKGKSLLDYNNIKLFSINYKKMEMKKICCIVCGSYRKFKDT